MAELDRIRWHCRRGLLELDLILEKFHREHLTQLDVDELAQFQELLALQDNDLLDLLMRRTQWGDARYNGILERLCAD